MSFNIYVNDAECPHCGRSGGYHANIANVTHYINSMVEKVFEGAGLRGVTAKRKDSGYEARSWGRFHGHSYEDVFRWAVAMGAWFDEHEVELEPMNPPSGWGSTKCIRRVLTAIIRADAPPNAVVEVSG